MGSRRLPPLLALLLLFGLMARALWLVVDGESPWTLLPGGTEPVTTDARGRFAFGDVTPDRPHELRVDGDDHAPVARPGLFLRPGERLDVGTLWLADGVRVALEVRAFDGRPLRGATVRAFAPGAGAGAFGARRRPSPVAIARTGADGVGYFEGLPPGTWTFTAERGGYARRGLVGATVRQGVAEEHFELALEQGYRLEGRFVFGTLPAADVALWAGWPAAASASWRRCACRGSGIWTSCSCAAAASRVS